MKLLQDIVDFLLIPAIIVLGWAISGYCVAG